MTRVKCIKAYPVSRPAQVKRGSGQEQRDNQMVPDFLAHYSYARPLRAFIPPSPSIGPLPGSVETRYCRVAKVISSGVFSRLDSSKVEARSQYGRASLRG